MAFVGVAGGRLLRRAADRRGSLCVHDTRPAMRRGTAVTMKSRGAKTRGNNAVRESLYIEVEDPSYDAYKVEPAVEILREGGLGVIPTDTSYVFVCAISSREGVNRIYSLKSSSSPTRKPLSILCRDLSMVQHYVHSLDRRTFKLLKQTLPGPYTYILPATTEVPRIVIEHKSNRKSWKRREIGVRVPDDAYCQAVLDLLDEPLLCNSVPQTRESMTLACNPADIGDNWCNQVDFVIDHGERRTRLSTVIDLTANPPAVVREGEGDVDVINDAIF
mmetsp:Transcript_8/g.24  ORF Transcript_8/g.24 Transcript_8/m.24 type:complete len:275 (-) Transcript_8:212-1036(-)